MGGKLQHATLENKCVFSLLKKKVVLYLCFNAKMKGIIQKSDNLDCQEPRLPHVRWNISRHSTAVLKKNLILGMRFSTQNTWRPYIVHFCRLLSLVKLGIILIHHKTRFFFPTSGHILGSPSSIDLLKRRRKFTSQHETQK